MNKVCSKCGSNNFKEAKVGFGFHAYVTENIPSTIITGGKSRSKLLTTFCLNCGEVQSFRVEDPHKFKK